MSTEVWIKWQTKWQSDPWGEDRDDLRMGILAQSVFHAMYGAVNRVIAALGGKDEFDYKSLPTAEVFMPYRRPSRPGAKASSRNGRGAEEPATVEELSPAASAKYIFHRMVTVGGAQPGQGLTPRATAALNFEALGLTPS